MGIRMNPERTLQVLLVLGCVLHASCGLSLAQASPRGQSAGSNSNAAASRNDNLTPQEALAMIKKPATITDFLQNVKFAVEHDLFLQKDFYSDENLERFFNTPHITWMKNEPLLKMSNTIPFAFSNPTGKNIDNPRHRSMYEHSGAGVTMEVLDPNRKLNASGKMEGTMGISAMLPLEVVENVFGTDMEVIDPYAKLYPQRPLTPPTHEYGNKALVYTFNTPLAKKAQASFGIDYDGTVSGLGVREEEK